MSRNKGENNPMFGKTHSDETKKKMSESRKKCVGEKSSSWKGGKRISHGGYIEVRKKDHHRTRKNGYVFEHILVAENKLGRKICVNEHVHHKDGNKQNNNPDNLEVLSHGEHTKITMFNRRTGKYLNCKHCGIVYYRKPYQAKKSNYCSLSCNAKGNNIGQMRTKYIPFHSVLELVKEGRNLKEIAFHFKVSESTIRKALKKHGYKGIKEIRKNDK